MGIKYKIDIPNIILNRLISKVRTSINEDIFVIEVNAKSSESNEHIPSALVWDLHQTFENSITLDVINDIQFKNLMEKNGISNLKNPALMIPILASESLRAANVLCTINWFAPQ